MSTHTAPESRRYLVASNYKMFFRTAFILYAICSAVSGNDDIQGLLGDVSQRIWLGNDAKPGQFPYQALLLMTNMDGNQSFCGGSLINDKYVLTAAHCCDRINFIKVFLGLTNVSDANSSSVVKLVVTNHNIIIHEQYDPKTIANDICLLLLPDSVQMTANISTIALPSKQDTNPSQYNLKWANISGFGQTNDQEGLHNQLEWSTVLLKPHSLCALYYTFINKVSTTQLCSGKIPWTGPCHGDSGGPLTILNSAGKPVEIGLVSWGVGSCASLINPVVYTYVPAYIDWINNQMT